MELNNFNLDISSYSNNDLLNLFSMNDIINTLHDKNFNNILLVNKNNLINQIQKRGDFSKTYKDKIYSFIEAASKKIIDEHTKNTNLSSNKGTWAQSQNPIVQVGSHIIQENANRIVGKTASISDGRIAGTDDAPPGWLNPINVKTVSTGINIDSRFRNNYYGTTASDFSIELPVEQKKVVNMRIATLDIPMSYYAVQRSRGDATILIVDLSPIDVSHCRSDSNEPNFDCYLDLLDPGKPKRVTFEEAYSIGTSNFEINESILSKDCVTDKDENPAEYQTAWLVVLPDGNYELNWCTKSDAADITNAMNNSLARAIRGIFFKRTGKFFAEEDASLSFSSLSTDETFIAPNIKNGLDPRKDICFNIDRISGKAIFAIPECGTEMESEREPDCDENQSIFSCGYTIYFNVQPGGSLSFVGNIQLYLGWQLGFRVAQYTCYKSLACYSEAPCMITGPRYMYLCINDGLKSAGNNFIAAFAQSTLSNDIITRINLANSMASTGVYKCTSDEGLSNQLNRTREYFGPVTINRLSFKLLDEYGRVLLFNDVDWSMSIVFEKLYD